MNAPTTTRLANFYVQRRPDAIFQPCETAAEALYRCDDLRARGEDAQCGIMLQTLIRATGQSVSIEVWPVRDNALDIPAEFMRERPEVQALADSLTRALQVRAHRDIPITNGWPQ